ncbi:MAG: hypothetical protein ACP6IU_04500 [Candidatus Asgardarchaeia archaeon]|nr:MAG: hypothetical protein DRO67_03050 [Candidatus Asgardarchaeum californiense]
MVREFLEVKSSDAFLKVAETATFVIRVDPYLFVQYFGFMIYIDLTRLKSEEVGALLRKLKDKFILIENIMRADSLSDFFAKKKMPQAKT